MRKSSILIRKLHRVYKNKANWEYSEFKGYPKGTYFGYKDFNELKSSTLKDFINFYGKGLRNWKSI